MGINERNFNTIEYYRKESKFRRQYTEGLQTLLESYGLSLLEAEILLALFADAGCDTVTKLCADLGKTKGIVSLSCDRLIRQKYLSSRTDKRDRRVVHFRLLSAAKKVIDEVSRYMEIMNSVQRAMDDAEFTKADDIIMTALLDTENSLIFPIVCNICDSCRFPNAPFRPYDVFIEEQCLPRIPGDRQNGQDLTLSLAELADKLDRQSPVRFTVPFQINRSLQQVEIDIEKNGEIQNTAFFVIKHTQNAAK